MFIKNYKSKVLKFSMIGVLIIGLFIVSIHSLLNKNKVVDTEAKIIEAIISNNNYSKNILLVSKYETIILPESCREFIGSTVTAEFKKESTVSTSGKVIGTYKGANIHSNTQWDENYDIRKIETSNGKVLFDIDNKTNNIEGLMKIITNS